LDLRVIFRRELVFRVLERRAILFLAVRPLLAALRRGAFFFAGALRALAFFFPPDGFGRAGAVGGGVGVKAGGGV